MKLIKYISACFLMFVSVSFLQAQETENVNVKKELKAVMKEMPYDTQLQVLRYAERKRDAIMALEAKKNELAAQDKQASKPQQDVVAPDQAKAIPQPAKAVEAQPQSIQLTPSNPAVTATPQVPKRPAYMEEAANMAQTRVDWLEAEFDFGKIEQGTIARHTFHFKNTGDAPLMLTRVKASCGCTTPNWSKDEIAPGEEGFVEINFNSSGKLGMQNKSVTVTGNFNGSNQILRFKGEVVQPETGTKQEDQN